MRTHLDLFSGIGGFALAAGWAGYDTIGFAEIDPFCQRVLRKHWPDVPVWDDVRTLTAERLRSTLADAERQSDSGERRRPVEAGTEVARVDLITAGYPCQPFSLAGKRLGAADDRHLWPEVRRLLAELRPARFLGENVAGHINMGLDDVLSDLEEIGYAARPVVIPACAVNAPHRRDRVWIIAAHTDRHSEPEQPEYGGSGPGQLAALGYADEPGSQGHGQHGERAGERITRASGPDARGPDVADTAGERERTAHDQAGAESRQRTRAGTGGRGWADERHETQQRMGQPHDGLPGRLADPRWGGDPMRAFGPDWEDGVPRVVATDRDRVNRLKALGNSVVPQVAYQVLLAMEDEA